MARVLLQSLLVVPAATAFQALAAPLSRAFRPMPAPAMLFGNAPPEEVMRVIKPAYEGAARGGEPFVVGTEKEMVAIWKAMVTVYGSKEDALTAVRKNQQVILPYVNSPSTIVGAHASLVEIFGRDGAAEIIRKNPGVLACNPTSLARTPRADIERAANFVAFFDGLDPNAKAAIPFITWFALVGLIGARVLACSGGACAADWDLKGGLGPQLVEFLAQSLGALR